MAPFSKETEALGEVLCPCLNLSTCRDGPSWSRGQRLPHSMLLAGEAVPDRGGVVRGSPPFPVSPCPLPHQALQHGAGERKGDVDRGPQEWQGQKEVQASQQGPLHLQDVPAWGLSHCGPAESAHRWQIGASSLPPDLLHPLSCKGLPFVVGIIKSCVFF